MLIVARQTTAADGVAVEAMEAVGVMCDVCKERVADPGADPGSAGFGTLSAAWGCGSAHFGLKHESHLCEDCFGDVAQFIVAKLKGRVRETDLFDPAAEEVVTEFDPEETLAPA